MNIQITPFNIITTGGTISNKDLVGKNTVLFFYPKADTPGCTSESKDFSELHDLFIKHNVQIFGISKDTLSAQTNFKNKFSMPFELIADVDKVLCDMFKVMKEKNMFGKKYIGIERSTFVIDTGAVLKKEWRNVKVPNHAHEVLDYISAS